MDKFPPSCLLFVGGLVIYGEFLNAFSLKHLLETTGNHTDETNQLYYSCFKVSVLTVTLPFSIDILRRVNDSLFFCLYRLSHLCVRKCFSWTAQRKLSLRVLTVPDVICLYQHQRWPRHNIWPSCISESKTIHTITVNTGQNMRFVTFASW